MYNIVGASKKDNKINRALNPLTFKLVGYEQFSRQTTTTK